MPPDFFAHVAESFWVVLQAGTAAAAAMVAKRFKDFQAVKKRESAERRAQDAVILAKLEKLAAQQGDVKAQVKNSHGTNLRHDLDVAIRNSQDARDNSTQALKIVQQIRDSLDALSSDVLESRREHSDFRERHNHNAEEIHDLNRRVNALFSAQNKKENNHE
jgi:predicted  nucleic acid-binding Zn-ribbon protein|nr:MAG TPA: Protein of unknown function (DUF2746) [Caudoviricetes sp.]